MKSMKQALAMLLCFLMLFSTPVNALATGTVSDGDVVVGTIEACDECGQTDGHTAECSQYADPHACAECKQADGHVETCSNYIAPVEKCEYCGIELIDGATHLETCLSR